MRVIPYFAVEFLEGSSEVCNNCTETATLRFSMTLPVPPLDFCADHAAYHARWLASEMDGSDFDHEEGR